MAQKLWFANADARDFLKKIPKEVINLVLTDPPYLVSRKSGFAHAGVEKLRVSMDFGPWDRSDPEEHVQLLDTVFSQCFRVLKTGGTLISFYDLWKLQTLRGILIRRGFRMLRFIEWVKTNPVPLNAQASYLTNAREVALVASKGSKPTFNARYHNGIFFLPIHRDGGKRLHPTQKPLALMDRLIAVHSREGETTLDPFAGSGTTLVSALRMGRSAVGCERDPVYFNAARERIPALMDLGDKVEKGKP